MLRAQRRRCSFPRVTPERDAPGRAGVQGRALSAGPSVAAKPDREGPPPAAPARTGPDNELCPQGSSPDDELDMPFRLTTGPSGSAIRTELEYDGSGARIVKRRFAGSNSTFPVAELTVSIGEMYERVTEQSGKKTHKFRVYAGGKQVAQVQRIEEGGTIGPDTTLYLHDDQLGSTSAITDEEGDQVERRDFTPFGEVSVNFSSTGVLSGFTGHAHDPELGLVNMRGRLYDSKLGRFVSADPFVVNRTSQGLNRYSYVENNPLNFVDPSGFSGCAGASGGCGPTSSPPGIAYTQPGGQPSGGGSGG